MKNSDLVLTALSVCVIVLFFLLTLAAHAVRNLRDEVRRLRDRVENIEDDVPLPPRHSNCRCASIPVIMFEGTVTRRFDHTRPNVYALPRRQLSDEGKL